jgi:hypothetical protein
MNSSNCETHSVIFSPVPFYYLSVCSCVFSPKTLTVSTDSHDQCATRGHLHRTASSMNMAAMQTCVMGATLKPLLANCSSRYQISCFKATEGFHSPYRAVLSHQNSIASFATLLVLSCIHSPRLHCSCCNVARLFALTLKHAIRWRLL